MFKLTLCVLHPQGKSEQKSDMALWRPLRASRMGILGHPEGSPKRSSDPESWEVQ